MSLSRHLSQAFGLIIVPLLSLALLGCPDNSQAPSPQTQISTPTHSLSRSMSTRHVSERGSGSPCSWSEKLP